MVKRYTVIGMARLAGTRTAPYPAPVEATPPTCPGCGGDLTGRKAANGLPPVYCGAACRKAYAARLHRARKRRDDEAAGLGLARYIW